MPVRLGLRFVVWVLGALFAVEQSVDCQQEKAKSKITAQISCRPCFRRSHLTRVPHHYAVGYPVGFS
ncbi:MAG: hypothetical protein ABJB22_02205 [Verrucomicrobiota bacterium]